MLTVTDLYLENEEVGHAEPITAEVDNIEGRPLYEEVLFSPLKVLKLMQYTGMRDKNGKEIYECDVVRIENYEPDFKHMETPADFNVFAVEHNRWTFAFNNANTYMPLANYDTRTLAPYVIEVIGNIYENPELVTNL